MSWRSIVAVSMPIACIPTLGYAQEPPSVTPAHESVTPQWYGGQILLAGAGASIVGVIGATNESREGLIFVGQGLITTASPIIHLANRGHPVRAIGGFLLEGCVPIATAVLGGFIGAAIPYTRNPANSNGDDDNSLWGAVAGYFTGAYTALAIDAFALAWKYEPRSSTSDLPARPATASAQPLFKLQRGGMTIGLSGSF